MRRFRQIEIQEYRGIRELVVDLGEHGIIATGTNGEGKSSVVNAVRTLAQGGDTGPDAVRNGAKQATLIALTDHERIRQIITARTASVEIKPIEGGPALKEPRKRLTTSVGALLDPLRVISEKKPEDVKKLVLETLDARATLADLRAFAPSLPDGFDCAGHAMEARKRAEVYVYDLRKVANDGAAQAEAEAARMRTEAAQLEAAVPAGARPLTETMTAREAARKALAALDAQAEAAARAATKTSAARQRIADLQATSKRLHGEALAVDIADEIMEAASNRAEAALAALSVADERIDEARAALRVAETARQAALVASEDAEMVRRDFDAKRSAARARIEQAKQSAAQAHELAATVADLGGAAPSQSDREGALFEAAKADAAVKASEVAEQAAAARRKASEVAEVAKQRRARADALDAQVKALREKAPAALMGDHGIEGVDLSEDEVMLTGPEGPVKLSRCCGFERLAFAVRLAKRVNAESKLVLVDGLEAVAEDQMDAFIDLVTEDGWTLVASLVTSGPLHIVSIDKGPVSEQLEARRAALRAAAV